MKIAIMGGASKRDSGILALGPEWQLWGLNACLPKWIQGHYRKIDKWFHIHRRQELLDDSPEHVEWFEGWAQFHHEIEFILLEPWAALPGATIFPREMLANMPRGDYHRGSFDWMVAYALALGATEIMLFGVKLHHEGGEPLSAAACLEYRCGYAEGRGVTVTAAKDCNLFSNFHLVRTNYVYGYDNWDLVEDRT